MKGSADSGSQTVCVTAASGFIGSWVVAKLLERGYNVRGTVRDPESPKVDHLRQLEGAQERLKLYKAHLLDYDSIFAAVAGCDGVFHNAWPMVVEITDPENEMLLPAKKGLSHVLQACAKAGVRRVLHNSSYLACLYNRDLDPSKVPDETSWADVEFYRQWELWYTVAKIEGEREAWQFAKDNGIDLITVLPGITLGPALQPTTCLSHEMLYSAFIGYQPAIFAYIFFGIVDVRDVADSFVLLYETPSAAGRYLCYKRLEGWSDLVKTISQMYPEYKIPLIDDMQPWLARADAPSKKLDELGLEFKPVADTIASTVSQLIEKGMLASHETSPANEYTHRLHFKSES